MSSTADRTGRVPASTTGRSTSALRRGGLLVLDAALIIVFAALGNRSHDTGLGIVDVLTTAAPFLCAWALATALMRSARRPSQVLPDGLVIWAGTVMGGMVLRVLLGLGGAPLSFVLVAASSLAVLLLGRRLVTGLLMPATRT